MFCTNCGASLSDEKFCPYCGQQVRSAQATAEVKPEGLNVVMYKNTKKNLYYMYYPNVIETEGFEMIEDCKEQARECLDENIYDYKEYSDDSLLNNKRTQKLIKKGYEVSIELLEANMKSLLAKRERILMEASDDVDEVSYYGSSGNTYTSSSDDFVDSSDSCSHCESRRESRRDRDYTRHSRDIGRGRDMGFDRDMGFGRDRGFDRGYAGRGVYAYIEHSGPFYNGGIPGLDFCEARMCHSYDDCVDELMKKFRDKKRSHFYEPPVQNLNEIKRRHPKAEIIRID